MAGYPKRKEIPIELETVDSRGRVHHAPPRRHSDGQTDFFSPMISRRFQCRKELLGKVSQFICIVL
jgi:hypothetical protein